MEKKTKLETIVKTETVEVYETIAKTVEIYVCSDGRSFDSLDKAEKYQRLLDIKNKAENYLKFEGTEDYDLVHCEYIEYIEAHYTSKYVDVRVDGKSESGWYFKLDGYDGSRNWHVFTPIEKLFKQIDDIKRVIEESEIDEN